MLYGREGPGSSLLTVSKVHLGVRFYYCLTLGASVRASVYARTYVRTYDNTFVVARFYCAGAQVISISLRREKGVRYNILR